MPTQTQTPFRFARRPSVTQDVHFHQGPQGQPVPCYSAGCDVPQMASEDIRDSARATRS